MKRKSLVIRLAAVVTFASLVACGGGGSGDSPASSGSDSSGTSGGIPATATIDGQAFVVWLHTLFADADSQGEPVKVEGGGALVDEEAEPRHL